MFWASPMFWKFRQPNVPYQDGWSTLNDPIFRAAELYLMAAEAIVKGATGAKLGTADVYYNRVLDRALGTANAGKIQTGQPIQRKEQIPLPMLFLTGQPLQT